MKKQNFRTYFFIASLFILSACNLINPTERIPAYLKIESFKVIDTNSKIEAMQGSYKITDVWVYVNNNPIGVFELPCQIPVLQEGKHTVQLYAGILDNGIASTRTEYPFYYKFSQELNFIPDSISTLTPNTNYISSINIPLNEDFEGVGALFDTTLNSNVKFGKAEKSTDPLVFEGQFSGKVEMSASLDSFEAISNDSYNIPKNRAVYLEMNYLSDNDLMVGMIVDVNANLYYFDPKITLFPNTKWNKIYINFTPEVNEMLNFLPNGKIKILLRSKHRSELDKSFIYVDNIKLVY